MTEVVFMPLLVLKDNVVCIYIPVLPSRSIDTKKSFCWIIIGTNFIFNYYFTKKRWSSISYELSLKWVKCFIFVRNNYYANLSNVYIEFNECVFFFCEKVHLNQLTFSI